MSQIQVSGHTLLIVALLAAPAEASQIILVARIASDNVSAVSIAPRGQVRFDSEPRWIIPNISAADVGTTWSVDESTAASYGLDWEAANTAVNAPGGLRIGAGIDWIGDTGPQGGSALCCGFERLTLDHITFSLLDWVQPPQSRFYYANTVASIYAEVPEPAGIMLLLVGLFVICYHPPYCRM